MIPHAQPLALVPCRAQGSVRFGGRSSLWEGRRARAIGSVCMAACTGAWAADSDFGAQALALASTQSRATPAIEYSTATYPSLSSPALREAQQPDSALSATSYGGSLQSSTITYWMTPERQRSLGVSMGVSAFNSPAAPTSHSAPMTSPLGLDMGVRWRSHLDTRRHLDVAAWARAPQNTHTPDAMQLIWLAQQPSFGTRVEMQWSSSRTGGLIPEFGAIGMQLDGDSRLVLRAKRGKPMVYYRTKF